MIQHIVLPWCPVRPDISLCIGCSVKPASSRKGIRTVKAQQWPWCPGCEHKIFKPWLRCGNGDLQPTCCRTNSIRPKNTGSSLWTVSSRFPVQSPCLQAVTPLFDSSVWLKPLWFFYCPDKQQLCGHVAGLKLVDSSRRLPTYCS